ncbi:hypothetical protein ElyMa_003937700 [Elysia marginata]|uniref:Secreted protein n=1 Tax=Elysia marginata TaxID=1093978 RepID=A0AAV4FRZ3_9GAST|nr:hypothetical protein ElyMa_003937700 [Elysia marginata]
MSWKRPRAAAALFLLVVCVCSVLAQDPPSSNNLRNCPLRKTAYRILSGFFASISLFSRVVATSLGDTLKRVTPGTDALSAPRNRDQASVEDVRELCPDCGV